MAGTPDRHQRPFARPRVAAYRDMMAVDGVFEARIMTITEFKMMGHFFRDVRDCHGSFLFRLRDGDASHGEVMLTAEEIIALAEWGYV